MRMTKQTQYKILFKGEKLLKKLQILGMGCPKCKRLTELTEQAAKEMGIKYEIEKVTDIKDIMEYGIMMTPGLVVDGEVKVAGKVPSIDDLKKMLE